MKKYLSSPIKLLPLLIVLLAYPLPWLVSYLTAGSYNPDIGFSLAFSLAAGGLLGIFLKLNQKEQRGVRMAALVFTGVFVMWTISTISGLSPAVLQQNVALLAGLLAVLGLVLSLVDRSLKPKAVNTD